MMKSTPEPKSPTNFEASPDSGGSGRGTSLAEVVAVGAKNFSSGIHGPKDAVSIGLQQDGATIR